MSNFSINHTVLTLRGNVVTNFSDAEDAILFDEIERATVRRGADGGMVGASTGNRGGKLTIKLLPDSPNISQFENDIKQEQNGNTIDYYGEIVDTKNNVSATLTGGTLVNSTPFPSLGKGAVSDMTYEFEFKLIETFYEAANFSISASVSF